MGKLIGVLATEQITSGLVEDHRLSRPLRFFPEENTDLEGDVLGGMPAEGIAESLSREIASLAAGETVAAIGVAVPGINRDGIIEESPNLQQLKGVNLLAMIQAPAPLFLFNDADVMAAGIAAARGQLDRLIRVWTLGNGVGFGRYPWTEGAWEGGHSVVSLDPKERFCGCGGVGHLEGIFGHRAIRLRFLDLEPDEVFENAASGDARCQAFYELAHRALAAATATSIHMEGPGKFFITGPNARYVDISLLNLYLSEMVKMSTLQGSLFELISTNHDIGVIGAAVNAERALRM